MLPDNAVIVIDNASYHSRNVSLSHQCYQLCTNVKWVQCPKSKEADPQIMIPPNPYSIELPRMIPLQSRQIATEKVPNSFIQFLLGPL